MLVKSWSFGVTLYLALFLRTEAKATFENNAYKDVAVTFSARLPPEDGYHLVESMQKILKETSSVLETAIGVRIGSVTFHVPETWNTTGWPNVEFVSSYNAKDKPDIQVKSLKDSAFGKKPFTFQYGGCGVPGLDISIPNEFIELEEEEEEGSHSKGKILAREWLKYRYGVFDENGFLEDPMYPTHYSIPGSDEIHVTDCTSPRLSYSFRDSENNTCLLTSETAANCSIRPNDEEVENVKSSLMFYHEDLHQLEHICGKEEHIHNIVSLNKQNLLCSYKSIWEVLQLHEDFRTQEALQSSDNNIEFSFAQESELRLVVAWQDTASLFDDEDQNSIIKAVRKLLYDIPSNSKVGLYSFKNVEWTVHEAFPQLADAIRNSWASDSNFGNDEVVKPLEALRKGIKVFEDNNENKKPGVLVIFTDAKPDPAEKLDELVEKLQKLKLCLTIIGLKGLEKEAWSKLLDASPCSSFVEIPDNKDIVKMYDMLYSAVEPIIPMQVEDSKIQTVQTKMLAYNAKVEILADPKAKLYTVWIFHSVQFECSLKNGPKINTTKIAKSTHLNSYIFETQNDTVECNMKNIRRGNYLIHVQKTSVGGEYFTNEVLFRDTTLSNSPEQMPYIIYAKVFYGEYPVRDANVQAEITTPENEQVALTLVDDGRGDPDITQYDGIYSKYFTKLDSTGTYKVKITVTDNDKKANASINGQDPCCGSVIVSDTFEIGEIETLKHETSFTTELKKPETGYKPSRVTDLRIDSFNLPDSFTLKWTASGGEMDEGKANLAAIKFFTSPEDLVWNFDNDSIAIKVQTIRITKHYDEIEILEVKLDDFNDNATYFFALQSQSANGLSSDTSNIVSFVLPEGKIDDKVTAKPPERQSGIKPETIGLIVGLILLAIVVVVVVYLVVYFMVLKPKRREYMSDSKSGSTSSHTRPSGLNSIPADVILKHHNEVLNAKSLHKDPPVFNDEKVEMEQAESNNTSVESENNNRNYALPSRTFQGDPHKSPKRMTVV